MKKLLIFVVLALFFVTVNSAYCSERLVKQGETLVQIAEELDETVEHLLQMNEWLGADSGITAGQKIVFISDTDINDAMKWCQLRMKTLWRSDPNHGHFRNAFGDLWFMHLRYSINEPSGTHFSSVIVYADAWRRNQFADERKK